MQKLIRKVLPLLLVVLMAFSSVSPIAHAQDNGESRFSENMHDYMATGLAGYLLRGNNFSYVQSAYGLFGNEAFNTVLFSIEELVDINATPDKEKYIEVLLNIITTANHDMAERTSQQFQLDNLKTIGDYGQDAIGIVTKSFDLPFGDQLEKVNDIIKTTEEWADNLSYLQTILNDYSNYIAFLDLVIAQSTGDLQAAAQSLKDVLEEAIGVRLVMFGTDLASEKISDWEDKQVRDFKTFLTDSLWEEARKTDIYNSAMGQFIVGTGLEVAGNLTMLGEAWDLGKDIGKFIGNVAFGGEDLINRVLEIKALNEIRGIVSQKVGNDLMVAFMENKDTELADSVIEDYVFFSNILISIHVRGEYVFTNMIAVDGRLLSMIYADTAEQARESFARKVDKLAQISEELNGILVGEGSGDSLLSLGIVGSWYSYNEADGYTVWNFDSDGNFEVLSRTFKAERGSLKGNVIAIKQEGIDLFLTLHVISSRGTSEWREADEEGRISLRLNDTLNPIYFYVQKLDGFLSSSGYVVFPISEFSKSDLDLETLADMLETQHSQENQFVSESTSTSISVTVSNKEEALSVLKAFFKDEEGITIFDDPIVEYQDGSIQGFKFQVKSSGPSGMFALIVVGYDGSVTWL